MDQFISCNREITTESSDGTWPEITLPFEKRQKTRQRAHLSTGEEVAIMLPRGTVMRGGDLLYTESGRCIQIIAAPESVSKVQSNNTELLARTAYHLGNRHVWVEVGPGWLQYLEDHVLDQMVKGLGLNPMSVMAPFEPEAGAYGVNPHHHSHD